MPKKVYNNVVDHRLLDNGNVAEDITSVSLPDIENPTTTIASAGMVADVDMPNTARVNAMELSISHNNGVNCDKLSLPGKHSIELRIARQAYDVPKGEIGHEGIKYRFVGVHKKTTQGTVETGNPMGSTVAFSLLRLEKVENGETKILIDAMAGILKFGGKDYTSDVENLLK